MNIYLDIDGVILCTESPIEDCKEFLTLILEKFSDTTYWLTTHCKDGENHTAESLQAVYPTLAGKLYETVKPTDWGDLKTDAIDFSKPFIWFDDTLLESEKEVLVKNDALASFCSIDPYNPRSIRQAIDILQQIQ